MCWLHQARNIVKVLSSQKGGASQCKFKLTQSIEDIINCFHYLTLLLLILCMTKETIGKGCRELDEAQFSRLSTRPFQVVRGFPAPSHFSKILERIICFWSYILIWKLFFCVQFLANFDIQKKKVSSFFPFLFFFFPSSCF